MIRMAIQICWAVPAVLVLSAAGCGGSAAARRGPDEGAALVAARLQTSGHRFGTDGSTRALWGYLSVSHRVVPAASARPGDVLFFATRASGEPPSCAAADHAGMVEAVTGDGRITFVEARAGRIRTSVVDPAHPAVRRDASGRVVNSFLRAKAVGDAPGTRYFAGEMLCGVARPGP
jgi:hypothetical protein